LNLEQGARLLGVGRKQKRRKELETEEYNSEKQKHTQNVEWGAGVNDDLA